MAKTSPLHRVIGAARWDAERPLGRLVVLAHAAFLDAGFVPTGAADDDDELLFPIFCGNGESAVQLPRKVGRTASSLPLRYVVPQLRRRSPDMAAVQLRLCAPGRYLVFYVSVARAGMFGFGRPWFDTYWICLDALAAAPLLSGGLDDAARALRRDARLDALWSALTDTLCRRVLVDLCARNGVTLEPTLMSLPGDAVAAILARLPDDEDLAMVECTCAGLRRLVAEHDATLWKPRYEKVPPFLQLLGVGDEEPTKVRWKKRCMAVRRWPFLAHFVSTRERRRRPSLVLWLDPWPRRMYSFIRFRPPFRSPEPPEEKDTVVPRRRRRRSRAMAREASHHGHALVPGGQKKMRHGAGAVHSPSSRFRWKHR
uniref:F-box domain-containing protein n=1 Tax=Oryza brachyantha TaxID=4533 RepID=J3N0Q3_ORYBR